ncbi:hypothetical protein ACFLZC_03080 [Patescibacteria group bacterium]
METITIPKGYLVENSEQINNFIGNLIGLILKLEERHFEVQFKLENGFIKIIANGEENLTEDLKRDVLDSVAVALVRFGYRE